MTPRFRSKFLLFEVAVVAALLGVGWGLFHVYGLVETLSRARSEPAPRPDLRQVRDLTHLAELRQRYLHLAIDTEHGVRLLRQALEAFIQDRTVSLGRYVRETESLHRRLAEAIPAADLPILRQQRDSLAQLPLLQAESNLRADLDFELAVVQISQAVSNHIAALNISETQPLTPAIVQSKLARTTDTERAILARANETRARAGRLAELLERHGVALASPALPTEELARRAGVQATLEGVMTILAGVFLLLAIVVIVAFYRHLVVFPLHQRIFENTASAEFQRKLDHFARLATGLAHEIRNPLTAINIRLFTLQKSLPTGGAPHADTVLIRNEIDRLEQILKNFLRLARPSEPKLARLTAGPILDETRTLLGEQCRRAGVELKVGRVTETPFMGDALQLKQVLINLVQNAAESIEGSGRITLRAHDGPAPAPADTLSGTLVAGLAPGNRNNEQVVVIEVEDTGTGIPPEVQERLFDPFFSTKENGTGLGLPIAAKIVDQHRGRLEFESRGDQGSTFRVILPAKGDSRAAIHG